MKCGQIYINGIIAFAFQDDFCNSLQEWSCSWFTKDAETPLVCFLLSINSTLGYISYYITLTLLNIISYISLCLVEIRTGAEIVHLFYLRKDGFGGLWVGQLHVSHKVY